MSVFVWLSIPPPSLPRCVCPVVLRCDPVVVLFSGRIISRHLGVRPRDCFHPPCFTSSTPWIGSPRESVFCLNGQATAPHCPWKPPRERAVQPASFPRFFLTVSRSPAPRHWIVTEAKAVDSNVASSVGRAFICVCPIGTKNDGRFDSRLVAKRLCPRIRRLCMQ